MISGGADEINPEIEVAIIRKSVHQAKSPLTA